MSDKIKLWLIGEIEPKLTTSKLPTRGYVLKALLYYISIKKSENVGANIVASNLETFWNTNGLPSLRSDKICSKLKLLRKEYNLLKKNKHRLSDKQRMKETVFKRSLRKLFDIAHGKFDSIVTSEIIKRFLKDQRSGRLMKVQCLNETFTGKRTHKKKPIGVNYFDESEQDEGHDENYAEPPSKRRKITNPSHLANKIIGSPLVTSTLDRISVSNGQFTLLMGSIASVMKANPSQTRLSRSTVQRKRSANRVMQTRSIKKEFISNSKSKRFVVHWDGKLLTDFMNPDKGRVKEKVDRIAVSVTDNGNSKLLGIPKVNEGTGHSMAEAVFGQLKIWKLVKNVIAMCSDTTSSNTGWQNGACIKLQEYLQKQLLYFPCRHHIFEVVLAGVFTLLFGKANSPNVQIFKQFKEGWNDIRTEMKSELHGLPESLFNSPLTQRLRTETIGFLQNILADSSTYIPREDYRELIDLTLIILGVPNPTYKLKITGALHHARWMCKVIYSFKMYLLFKHLGLTEEFRKILEDFCLFCSLLYVKQWFTAPLLLDAAVNDLRFCENLKLYESINEKISERAIFKFGGHLSYLGPELAAFALFSDKVTDSEKRIMIAKMKKPDGHWRRSVHLKDPHSKNITDLITSRSLFTIDLLDSTVFKFMLHTDPTLWTTCRDFNEVNF